MNLESLNKSQMEAVKKVSGPVMVMAGAGSGKTRVLTYRIAYLIQEIGISPDSILALTFTNKAAREMKERVEKIIEYPTSNMWISTFHSFGARFLRTEITYLNEYTRRFNIIDDDDQEKIIKKIIKEKNLATTYREGISYIGAIKNNESLGLFKDQEQLKILNSIYNQYLKENNLLDFDDLLYLTYIILRDNEAVRLKYQNKFNYILIDEFQDTNKIQFQLIDLLVNKEQNVFVVGDINQSIYSFRGARVENVNMFAKNYHLKEGDNIIKLEKNYRSTKNILGVANSVIRKNESFVNLKLETDYEDGDKVVLTACDSGYGEIRNVISEIRKLIREGFEYKDIAIMYRINSLSLGFETELVKEKIPYIIYGGVGYYSRKEVKDVLAYLRLAINPEDDFSFRRIINTPKRKIGEKQINDLAAKALLNECSLYNAIDSSNKLLYGFKHIMEEIKDNIDKISLPRLIDFVLDKTGYLEALKNAEEEERIDNVLELKSIMKDLVEKDGDKKSNQEILNEFLMDLALKTDVDNVSEDDNKVKLINFHQAKGLEYGVVFIVALENGIFPSSRSFSDKKDYEEERRIFYVGITRAKRKLYLSYANYRRMYGDDLTMAFSPFLREIDNKYLEYKGVVAEGLRREKQVIKPKIFPNGAKHKMGEKINHVDYGDGVIVGILDGFYRVAFTQAVGVRSIKFDDPKINNSKSAKELLSNQFYVGDKIIHKVFGVGKIIDMEGEYITVAFEKEFGIKRLLSTHPSISKYR